MKRIFCVALALLVVVMSAAPAMAAVSEPDVSPQYTYIQTVLSALAINQTTGITSCKANCVAYGGDSIRLTCTLQRYNGSSWVTVKSWSATAEQSTAINKYYAVPSGYTYRVRATCSVYRSDGLLIESGTCYSHQVEY